MSDSHPIDPVLLLSPQWWSRLQRVATACYASPKEFVREAIEAEIVKRELLLENQGKLESRWVALLNTTPASTRLQ